MIKYADWTLPLAVLYVTIGSATFVVGSLCVRLDAWVNDFVITYLFFGCHPYALAQAPPISMARSESLSRFVSRNGLTPCS